jgi:hypothetical protein
MCLVTVFMSEMFGHLGETLHGIEIEKMRLSTVSAQVVGSGFISLGIGKPGSSERTMGSMKGGE